MTMKHAPSGAFFVALAALLSPLAHAELTIEISQRLDSAIPVEVAQFDGFQVAENIGAIIRQDLDRSGDLRAVSAALQPLDPEDPANLAAARGAPDLRVSGQVSRVPDGRYRFQYRLYNAARGETLLTESLLAGSGRWREVAHLISDRIYQKITGFRGIFSTRLLFVQEYRQGKRSRYRLAMSDADGRRQVTVLDSDEPVMAPSWSPNARQVAYVSFESGRAGVYVHDLASRQRQLVSEGQGIASAPAWSPDGRRLALSLSRDGNPELYVLTLATRDLQRVTQHPAIDTEPRWSPDGQTLYFTSDRGGAPQIYKVAAAGGEPRRVTFSGRFNARCDISPQGDRLAVVHEGRGGYQIAVQDLRNGIMDEITQTPLDGSPSFAPNGRQLIYSTRVGNRHLLAISSVDGRFNMRLPPLEGLVREPAWSPFLQ